MSERYYQRQIHWHTDGSPIYETEEDERLKLEVAQQLEARWEHSRLVMLGKCDPVDALVLLHERTQGAVEIKCRDHYLETYPTVYLNVRKYWEMRCWSQCNGKPALFVVRFRDASIYKIRLHKIPILQPILAGCRERVKSSTDIEPVYEIPVGLLRSI